MISLKGKAVATFPNPSFCHLPSSLSKILVHDSGRNQLIIEDIKAETNAGKKVLLLTERKGQIDVLQQY